jgi:hypothetical protein
MFFEDFDGRETEQQAGLLNTYGFAQCSSRLTSNSPTFVSQQQSDEGMIALTDPLSRV